MRMTALVYPYTQFTSREWLRTAFLYYDTIARIVPRGTDPDHVSHYAAFSREPVKLRDDVVGLKDAGFIEDEPPDTKGVPALSERFQAFAIKNLADPKRRARFIPKTERKSFYLIHPDKMGIESLETLRARGLALRTEGQAYSEWKIEPVTGLLYMLFLARAMAATRSLVTDEPAYQALFYDRVDPSLLLDHDQSDDPRFQLVTAVIPTFRPQGLERIPLKALIRFKNDHEDARRSFGLAIQELSKDLSSAKDKRTAKEVLDSHREKVTIQVKNLKRKVRSLKVGAIPSLMSVSVPSYLTSTWGLGLTDTVALITAGGLALTAAAVKYAVELKTARAENSYDYLLNLQGLRAKELAKRTNPVSLVAFGRVRPPMLP
jgi:hypothetical protein